MKKISRRNFLLASGAVTIGAALAAVVVLLPPAPLLLLRLPLLLPLLPQHRARC